MKCIKTNYTRLIALFFLAFCTSDLFCQNITIDGTSGGKRFDGIGAVSGGGATSVLLKDYPEPQRSQILDLLFKPKFGASMPALYVEIPGDGNATQGSELSHMHTKNDENYGRGYEWWLIREAKKRKPSISLDGAAWCAPHWVGNNNYWSQDLADYYVKWIKGLKTHYGYDMDAIGCRNEWGTNTSWVKTFRSTLNRNGLNNVKIHAFDEAGDGKWNWIGQMNTDATLRSSVDIFGNHTFSEVPANDAVKKMSNDWNKPIWNTEEHPYDVGYDGAIKTINTFNKNYIQSGATKVMNWYLITSFYPIEPYFNIGAPIEAASPWSGNYKILPKLWAYAHYGQFVELGWKYVNGACGYLSKGSYVTLANATEYSTIIETLGASGNQTLNITVKGGLSTGKVCVWRTNNKEQFIKLPDITPVNGSYSVTLEPYSIYTISTTTGQQKGGYANVPAEKGFPFPYYENFDHYGDLKLTGYLPLYTADITGGFELANSPTGTGKCLYQVVAEKDQSWAPEWMPYSVIGDKNWKDYEVSADVYLDNGGWAGVMGRVNNTGGGYGCNPKGYYLRLWNDGGVELWEANQSKNGAPGNRLATGKASNVGAKQWHNVKLQFAGSTIKGFVDNVQVLSANSNTYGSGMAGFVTGGENNTRNTAYFDNFIINSNNSAKPPVSTFGQDATPPYAASTIDPGTINGVEEDLVAEEIKCFPNPFSNNFQIQASGNFSYTIYNVRGVTVEKGTGDNTTYVGDGLQQGIFMVKIETVNGVKFIKVQKF